MVFRNNPLWLIVDVVWPAIGRILVCLVADVVRLVVMLLLKGALQRGIIQLLPVRKVGIHVGDSRRAQMRLRIML